jgi:hypothetical protein
MYTWQNHTAGAHLHIHVCLLTCCDTYAQNACVQIVMLLLANYLDVCIYVCTRTTLSVFLGDYICGSIDTPLLDTVKSGHRDV